MKETMFLLFLVLERSLKAWAMTVSKGKSKWKRLNLKSIVNSYNTYFVSQPHGFGSLRHILTASYWQQDVTVSGANSSLPSVPRRPFSSIWIEKSEGTESCGIPYLYSHIHAILMPGCWVKDLFSLLWPNTGDDSYCLLVLRPCSVGREVSRKTLLLFATAGLAGFSQCVIVSEKDVGGMLEGGFPPVTAGWGPHVSCFVISTSILHLISFINQQVVAGSTRGLMMGCEVSANTELLLRLIYCYYGSGG